MPRTSARLAQLTSPGSGLEGPLSAVELFAYGTLMFDEVIATLIGRLPDHHQASADDWAVVRLPGRVYPGLVRSPGACARGRAYSGLTAEEWDLLDAFEDEEYLLSPITLVATQVDSLTYAWPHPMPEDPWNPAEFRTRRLSSYLEQCAKWRLFYDAR